MKNHIIYLFALCGLWAGCSTDEIPRYDGDNYIQFKKTQDTVTMAFFLYSGTEHYDYPIQVEMSGQASTPGREYKLVVDEKYSTAVEGRHYTLPERTAFEADEVTGMTWVRFIRTPDMKTERYTLVLRVEDNGNYRAGQEDKRFLAIKVHDQIAQPEWWDYTVIGSYLGAYSDLKFEYFLQANNYPDLTDAKGKYAMIRAYALALKRFLDEKKEAGEPILEMNGNPMTVVAIN